MNDSARQDRVGIVGCRIWSPDGTIWHGGMRRIGWPLFGHIDHNRKYPTIHSPKQMDAVTFCAVLVKRRTYFDCLGFDQRFDCYSEDVDLCLTARSRGWLVMYNPNAEAIHDESSSSTPDQKQAMELESRGTFVSKWRHRFIKQPA